MSELDDEKLGDLREFVRMLVAAGFDLPEEIVEAGADYLDGEAPRQVLFAAARALVQEALEEHAVAQAGWPEETDCDKLDAAFAALERQGIVARQHFTCCQTCGHAEIGDEAKELAVPARGYTFFHHQDTESAVEGRGVMLAYGSFGEEPGTEAIGREVVEALRGAGLEVEWDGQTSRRIWVKVDWQRRRPQDDLEAFAD